MMKKSKSKPTKSAPSPSSSESKQERRSTAEQMAKRQRGFGGKLEVRSFGWKPPNQNFDNEKEK